MEGHRTGRWLHSTVVEVTQTTEDTGWGDTAGSVRWRETWLPARPRQMTSRGTNTQQAEWSWLSPAPGCYLRLSQWPLQGAHVPLGPHATAWSPELYHWLRTMNRNITQVVSDSHALGVAVQGQLRDWWHTQRASKAMSRSPRGRGHMCQDPVLCGGQVPAQAPGFLLRPIRDTRASLCC